MEVSEAPLHLTIFSSVLMTILAAYVSIFHHNIYISLLIRLRFGRLNDHTGRSSNITRLRSDAKKHNLRRIFKIGKEPAPSTKHRDKHRKLKFLFIFLFLLAAIKAAVNKLIFDSLDGLYILVAALVIPSLQPTWIRHKAKLRATQIQRQLPDALDLLVRSLRIGHPFSSALNIAALESPNPLGDEISLTYSEYAHGRDLNVALNSFAERIGIKDLCFLSVAVGIQQQSGGNLAEILDNLAKIIRLRLRLLLRVSAITSEARWSGAFLSISPIAAAIIVNLIDPQHYSNVYSSEYFAPAATAVVGLLIANMLTMKALTNLKV